MTTDTDIITALARKREAENATLRRERDQLKADAMSDLNRIHRQKATIRRLEAKCAALEVDKAAVDASNAALRAGQGRWPDGDDSPAGEQVPRVITADELTLGAGQWIAYRNYNPPHEWIVEKYDKDEFSPHYDGTIVLLEDAPWDADLLETTKLHTDQVVAGVVTDLDTPPAPRLTVHALNTAPAGTEVAYGAAAALKRRDGRWGVGILRPPISAEELLARITEADGLEDATLTHPERGDHE